MATITKDTKPGLDSISQNQVQSVSFEGYMIAHFMGIASRDERCRMHKEMLNHGIVYYNDDLACAGLRGSLRHIFKEREVSNEGSAKILEPFWNKEKEEEWFTQVEVAVKLIEDVVTSFNFYSRGPSSRDGYVSNQFTIGFPKTWKLIISEVSALCWKERKFEKCAEQVSQENVSAFRLYARLGTAEIFREACKKQEREGDRYSFQNLYLVDESRKDVIDNLKDHVIKMPLERVIFWLKNYGDKMPSDFQKVFRIEFVRKNGEINLDMKL